MQKCIFCQVQRLLADEGKENRLKSVRKVHRIPPPPEAEGQRRGDQIHLNNTWRINSDDCFHFSSTAFPFY